MNRAAPRRMRGVSAIETLVAAPVVLLLGLSVLQWALLFHGYQAVSHAALEGARAGSVAHASAPAVDRGLARGLAPWMFGASDPDEHARAIEHAAAEFARGSAAGWAGWRRISPTRESFLDWAVPARDDAGESIPGVTEIPNDNLGLLAGAIVPVGGIDGYRSGESIGAASAQTLADANMLKIEFTYGVPLVVPFVGRLAARIMQAVDGCGGSSAGAGVTGGVGAAGAAAGGGGSGAVSPRTWTCAHYAALDARGQPLPRWPVRVSAAIRMQSPARDADASPSRSDDPTGNPLTAAALDAGAVASASSFEPLPVARVNPGGAGPGDDGSVDRAPGFLKIGADRLIEVPGVCTAP